MPLFSPPARTAYPHAPQPGALSGAEICVVGGGLIGLSIAWRLAGAGASVTVLRDTGLKGAASPAAGGMLSLAAETAGEAPDFLALCAESQRRWPAFAADLEDASGRFVDFLECGTLLAARNAQEAEALACMVGVEALMPSDWRALEPGLAGSVVAAAFAPKDGRVDNRLVLGALETACLRAGVAIPPGGACERLMVEGGRIVGAERDGETVRADTVVLAAGTWTDGILRASGLTGALTGVEPVKGQMAAFAGNGVRPVLAHVVRAEGLYLVPRSDGRIIVGATSERCGFDLSITSEGVGSLLDAARALVPALGACSVIEAWAGLRPFTALGRPIIGAKPLPGLVIAGGHYRNGVLLTPVTADLVAGGLAGSLTADEAALSLRFGGIDARVTVLKVETRSA